MAKRKYNFVVRDREAGNVICETRTREDAEKTVEMYEMYDKINGEYTPDFYEVAEINL